MSVDSKVESVDSKVESIQSAIREAKLSRMGFALNEVKSQFETFKHDMTGALQSVARELSDKIDRVVNIANHQNHQSTLLQKERFEDGVAATLSSARGKVSDSLFILSLITFSSFLKRVRLLTTFCFFCPRKRQVMLQRKDPLRTKTTPPAKNPKRQQQTR